MNENLANEIRKTIESVKDMKIQVGGINNYLSILEGMIRADYQKQVDEAYQRGLNDAWEAARKIVLNPDEGGTSLTDIYVMFGNNGSMQRVFRSYLASEVIEKLKACEKKRKADNEIKVGDVVERYINGKFDSTGIFLGEDGDYWNCLFWTGAVFGIFAYPKNQFKKTGIHLGIDMIMEKK